MQCQHPAVATAVQAWPVGHRQGIKRSVSAVGLCTQTRQLKGLMFMLCPQGGHWGWERVVEGRTCGVCVSPLSQRRNRAGDGRVRLASGKGTVPQLPSLQRLGLGMADNAVVPGRLQGTPWLCSGPQESWRTSPGSGDGSKGKELFHHWF